MTKRIPFSEVGVGNWITFDSGYHMTGTVVASIGTYAGKRLIEFREDGATLHRYIVYAVHRSVILRG